MYKWPRRTDIYDMSSVLLFDKVRLGDVFSTRGGVRVVTFERAHQRKERIANHPFVVRSIRNGKAPGSYGSERFSHTKSMHES